MVEAETLGTSLEDKKNKFITAFRGEKVNIVLVTGDADLSWHSRLF
jgi:hypothetical protein